MFHAADRVLVGVMPHPRDLTVARDLGWYRIPLRHAPPSVKDAAVLAFYFTAAFDEERWAVHWYAEVRGHELVLRRHLFPDQADHPRADEQYYKVQIGPLLRREPPVRSLRWRRIVFIESTWDRFNSAEEINDLYLSGADGLYVTLKESGFFPECDYLIHEGSESYTADMAIPCRDGIVAVMLDEGKPAPTGALSATNPELIREAVAKLGGSVDPRSV